MRCNPTRPRPSSFLGFLLVSAVAVQALAGGPFERRRGRVVETVRIVGPRDRVAPTGMLGTFNPTPLVVIGSNSSTFGGFSPIGFYGRENSLNVYGPLSAFRETSAPVNTVVRGYNGIPTAIRGTTYSNPNLPDLSPVVYPTRASNYSALRYQGTSPYRDRAYMWIDQN